MATKCKIDLLYNILLQMEKGHMNRHISCCGIVSKKFHLEGEAKSMLLIKCIIAFEIIKKIFRLNIVNKIFLTSLRSSQFFWEPVKSKSSKVWFPKWIDNWEWKSAYGVSLYPTRGVITSNFT